jgi:hypothetical protein
MKPFQSLAPGPALRAHGAPLIYRVGWFFEAAIPFFLIIALRPSTVIPMIWACLSYPALLFMFVAMDGRGVRLADLKNRWTLLRVGLVTAVVLSATYGAAAWFWLSGEIGFDHAKCQTIADMIEAGKLGQPGDDEIALPPHLRDATLFGKVSICRATAGHFQYYETWHNHASTKGYAFCPTPHSTPPTEAEIGRDEALIRTIFHDPSITTVSTTEWPGWYYVTIHGY